MHWLAYLHNRTGLFTKVLMANAVIAVGGSLAAVALATGMWSGERPGPVTGVVFVLIGLVMSLGVNYAILRVAFRPLFTMQATLDRVRRGDYSARVPLVDGDPDIAQITETANLMLDRLAEHRQAISSQILRALEEERKRIARELHDETSQSLTSMLVNIESIERLIAEDVEEASSRLRITKDIARRTLDETRRLMFDLRPSVLDDLGLVPALRWFISQRVMPRGLLVDFQAADLEQRLPEELETAMFRILQEAITNTVKHAKAKHLTVQLFREPGRIVALVKDDGVGFHPVHVAGKDDKDRGLGLFGMHERAALVGGAIQIDSAPGRGTTARVSVPDRVGGKGALG